jgi:putative transposase
MKVLRAFKTEIDPNNIQRTLLLKHAGAARYAYNWGLSRKIETYKATGKSPSAIDLHRELNRLKRESADQGGVPWMYEVSKWAPQEALRSLDVAFRNFFRRCKNGDAKKGFPRFKSRKRGVGGFRLMGPIHVSEDRIQLPRIGTVRLKERGYLPSGDSTSVSITETAGRWFVSVTSEKTPSAVAPSQGVVGIDVGIAHLATLSTGEVFENPRALRSVECLMRVRSKALSRKVNGSSNRRKAVHRIARLHYRILCIRKDAAHKASTSITKRFGTIVVESLNVKGMMRNRRLSKALSDAAIGEFLRQIKYKAAWCGDTLIEAPPFFPSSKTCSGCGHILDGLSLSTRKWTCPLCGRVHDRDVNAAVNLAKLAGSSPASACCPGSTDRRCPVKLSVGQEPNATYPPG